MRQKHHLALSLTSGFLLVAPWLAIAFYDLSGQVTPVGDRACGMH